MQVKPKTPKGIWALRAVTAVVALIVVLVLASVAYSAYEDYTAVRSELEGGSSPAVGNATINGSTESITLSIPVPNRGLYTLNVTMSCTYPTSDITCSTARVSVPPGGQGTLMFRMSVANITQFEGLGDRDINGTVAIQMPPFASVSIVTDFGGLVSAGGGG